jgi:hypothetical protein
MIFLINDSKIFHPALIDLSLEKDLDLFVWNISSKSQSDVFAPETYHSLTNENILLSLKASLKDSKSILITNGSDVPKSFDHNLKKQRVFIENSSFIFFSPRASFFFKAPLVSISINSFIELETIVRKWGK